NGPTDTGTPGTSRSMNARSVPTARYAPHAQRQPTVGTERFTTMKNGKHKKHISERSFRKKKPVRFTANVKSMVSPSLDFGRRICVAPECRCAAKRKSKMKLDLHSLQ